MRLGVGDIALDIGTTRVVARLLNLETGENMGEIGFDNPQIKIAPDVLARIHHAKDAKGLEELRFSIIDAVNESVDATGCGGTSDCQHGEICLTHHLWCGLSEQIHNFLSQISLANLVAREEVQYISARQEQRTETLVLKEV